MNDWQARTRALLGDAAVKKLNNASVAVFGIGGVGSCERFFRAFGRRTDNGGRSDQEDSGEIVQ